MVTSQVLGELLHTLTHNTSAPSDPLISGTHTSMYLRPSRRQVCSKRDTVAHRLNMVDRCNSTMQTHQLFIVYIEKTHRRIAWQWQANTRQKAASSSSRLLDYPSIKSTQSMMIYRYTNDQYWDTKWKINERK